MVRNVGGLSYRVVCNANCVLGLGSVQSGPGADEPASLLVVMHRS